MPILKINNFTLVNKDKKIIDNLNLVFEENRFYTVFGLSGSAKTILRDSIFNLLPEDFERKKGDIFFKEDSVFSNSSHKKKILSVFTNSETVFNENYKVGVQLKDILFLNKIYTDKAEFKKDLQYYLDLLDIDEKFMNFYPYEIDRKTLIKISFILPVMFKPDILIIDDSLHKADTLTNNLIYLYLKKVKENMTIVFFTSVNNILSELSDEIIYLYNGRILEKFKVKQGLKFKHPYRELFENKKVFNSETSFVNNGNNLDLTDNSKRCIYYDMCPLRTKKCLDFDNKLIEYEKEHFISCLNLTED